MVDHLYMVASRRLVKLTEGQSNMYRIRWVNLGLRGTLGLFAFSLLN